MNNGRMRNRRAIAGLALLLTVVAGIVWAADRPEPRKPSLVTMTEGQAARLSPLHQAMRGILIAEQKQLAVLYEEFAQQTDSQRALEVQRRIHEVKVGTEISLLTVQAETAREQGRMEDAEQLEEGIERLANPDGFESRGPAPGRRPDQADTDR
jgi:hypothetical protein